MEVVGFFNGKGKIIGSGSVRQAVASKVWYKVGVMYVVNDKLQVLLYSIGRKNGGDGVWRTIETEVMSGQSAECILTDKFKREFNINILYSRLQPLLNEKYKLKIDGKTNKQFVDMYVVKKNIDINAINNEDKKVKWVQLKTYISYLEGENKNYKKYSKNNAKILKAYLNFKQFINNR